MQQFVAVSRRPGLLACLPLALFTILTGPLSNARAIDEHYQQIVSSNFVLYVEQNPLGEFAQPYTSEISGSVLRLLESIATDFAPVWGNSPDKIVLRLLSPPTFYHHVLAPPWSEALFRGGEIHLPLLAETPPRQKKLSKILRHEYTHALVASRSGSRCPAWLDEGIALLSEQAAHPELEEALKKWQLSNEPFDRSFWEDGFTRLSDERAIVAYAQSLFAARMLVTTSGYASVLDYLSHLQRGDSPPASFELAFGKSQSEFEAEFLSMLREMART